MTDVLFSGESSGAVSVAAGTVTGTEPSSPGLVAARTGFGVGDEVSLVPAGSPGPPMAAPADAWAMLVIGVDLDLDGSGRVESFIGFWSVRDTPHPPEVGADDVVSRMTLTHADTAADEFGGVAGDRVDIEMLLATRGGWHVGGPVAGPGHGLAAHRRAHRSGGDGPGGDVRDRGPSVAVRVRTHRQHRLTEPPISGGFAAAAVGEQANVRDLASATSRPDDVLHRLRPASSRRRPRPSPRDRCAASRPRGPSAMPPPAGRRGAGPRYMHERYSMAFSWPGPPEHPTAAAPRGGTADEREPHPAAMPRATVALTVAALVGGVLIDVLTGGDRSRPPGGQPLPAASPAAPPVASPGPAVTAVPVPSGAVPGPGRAAHRAPDAASRTDLGEAPPRQPATSHTPPRCPRRAGEPT